MIAFKVAGVLDIPCQRYSRRIWLIIGSLHYFSRRCCAQRRFLAWQSLGKGQLNVSLILHNLTVELGVWHSQYIHSNELLQEGASTHSGNKTDSSIASSPSDSPKVRGMGGPM